MAPESKLKRISRTILGIFFIVAGINHFLNPAPYLAMMPPWLPWHVAMNQISGVAEIVGGLGILIPWKRRCAAWGLIALLIAVFPANLQVALYGWPGTHIPAWILWARLPFQPLFIAWVYLTCLRRD